MFNFLTTALFLISWSSYGYAESYDITINIDGEAYYSDTNSFDATPVMKKSRVVSMPRQHGYQDLTLNKQKYADLIAKAADRHQVDANLLHAVIRAESAYDANAISPAGAMGLMQLMPGTAKRYGVTDRGDPDQNIDGGTRYLKHLLQLFDSNLDLAVAAYNAGENAVIRHNNTIPPYPETRHYVKEVLSLK